MHKPLVHIPLACALVVASLALPATALGPPAGAPSVVLPAATTATAAAADPAILKLQLQLARRYVAQKKDAAARQVLTGLIAEGGQSDQARQARILLADLDRRRPAEDALEAGEGRGMLVMGNAAAWMSVGLFAPLLWLDDMNDYISQSYWSAVGFALPAGVISWAATRDMPISRGYATMQTSSQLLGMTEGFLLAGVLQGSDLEREFGAGLALAGTAAGLAVSVIFKDQMQVSRARASFMFSSWMWGSLLGLYGAMTLWDDDVTIRQNTGAAMLVGGGALAAAVAWGPRWSSTRVGYVSLFGLGGYLVSYALLFDRIGDDDLSVRSIGTTLLATQAVGLVIGVLVTSGMEDERLGAAADSRPLVAGSLLRFDDGRARLSVPLPRLGFSQHGADASPHLAFDLLAGSW